MNEKIRPRCQYPAMKSWQELSEEQKMLAERLPAPASLSLEAAREKFILPALLARTTRQF